MVRLILIKVLTHENSCLEKKKYIKIKFSVAEYIKSIKEVKTHINVDPGGIIFVVMNFVLLCSKIEYTRVKSIFYGIIKLDGAL